VLFAFLSARGATFTSINQLQYLRSSRLDILSIAANFLVDKVPSFCYNQLRVSEKSSVTHFEGAAAMGKIANRGFILCAWLVVALPFPLTSFAIPQLHCGEPIYDFGSVFSDEAVYHQFVLENKGNSPLRFGSISTQCGCTLVESSQKDVLPGESASFTVSLDVRGKSGPQKLGFSVETNDPENPIYEFSLVGDVAPLIILQPPSLEFGMVAEGIHSRKVQLSPGREGFRFSVKGIRIAEDGPVRVTYSPVEESKQYEILVEVDCTNLCGDFVQEIGIVTDDPFQKEVILQVSGTVQCDLRVEPKKVVLSELQLRGENPIYLRVLPGVKEHPSVKDVQIQNMQASVKFTRVPDGGYILKIFNFIPSSLKGNSMVRIIPEPGSGREIFVPVTIGGAERQE
jgi:hypothetical protein